MAFDTSKVFRIEIIAILVASPLIIWLGLYLAARWWSVNSRTALPWLKCLRWIGWGGGLVLVLLSLVREGFPLFYGIAMATFSAGLSIPKGWIKHRFAPDLVDPDRDWWPS